MSPMAIIKAVASKVATNAPNLVRKPKFSPPTQKPIHFDPYQHRVDAILSRHGD